MTAISRSPRPRVVDKKSGRTLKKGPKVTELDLQDSDALKRAVALANRGLSGREKVSDVTLAKYAAPFGGCRHPQTWAGYRHGRRHIPSRDKVISAMFFSKLPERLFPSWEEAILPMLLHMIAFATRMGITPAGQGALGELLQGLAQADPVQRDAMLKQIQGMLDGRQAGE